MPSPPPLPHPPPLASHLYAPSAALASAKYHACSSPEPQQQWPHLSLRTSLYLLSHNRSAGFPQHHANGLSSGLKTGPSTSVAAVVSLFTCLARELCCSPSTHHACGAWSRYTTKAQIMWMKLSRKMQRQQSRHSQRGTGQMWCSHCKPSPICCSQCPS